MYNIFKPQRFGRLFMKFTAEQYKSYLMSLGVLIGILLLGGIFLVYVLNARMEIGLQLLLLTWVIFFAGTVFTSTVFTQLGDSKKAISALTLPASHFEKFLVAWLYSYIILPAVLIPCFYLVMLFLLNIRHFPGPQEEAFSLFQPVPGAGGSIFFLLLVLYGLFHSIAFYGAIYFKKLHFIKTALIFFLTIAILIIGNSIYMHQLIHREIQQVVPFTAVRFLENGRSLVVNPVAFFWVGQMVYIVLALTFWSAAYFRLKEKQV